MFSHNKMKIIKFLLLILIIIFSPYLQLSKNINKNEKNIFPSKTIDFPETEKKLNLSLEFIKIYSILFDAAKNGLTQAPKNSTINFYPNHRIYKKGVGICTIGRNENLYAKEFVEYYIKLGIKKIIIYDNNDINGENFSDILKEYLINKKVEIIDIHGFESAQFPSYNDCYKRYGSQFDFLLFLDFDEFVIIEDNMDINKYLYNKQFKKCETIYLNWIMYGDNNLLNYDNRTMIERFSKPISKWNRGKSIVRTNIPNLIISSTHIIGINTEYFCDSNGKRIFPTSFYDFEASNDSKAYIKHFFTKTAEEFCNKIKKGDGHFHKSHPLNINVVNSRIEMFFNFNSMTNEKLRILEKCIGMNLNKFRK